MVRYIKKVSNLEGGLMNNKDRSDEILKMIRARNKLPKDQQGWVSGPILTEVQPPDPLPEDRWADFNQKFVEELDGEPIGASGYSTQAFYDKLVDLCDPDYVIKKPRKSTKLREMLEELGKQSEQEKKQVEQLRKLDCFETNIVLKDEI